MCEGGEDDRIVLLAQADAELRVEVESLLSELTRRRLFGLACYPKRS